jgi:transcriptional regulator with PAS, ATPase and Fis domain
VAVDLGANIFFFNKAAGKMLAYSPERALGQHVRKVIPDSRLPLILKTGKAECSKRHFRGRLTFLTNRTPIMLDGKMIGAMSQFQDVHQGEDPLSQLADVGDFITVMEMVMDNAYVGLIFCDANGIIRFMNRLYEDLLKIKRETAYGKHITEYFPDSRLPMVIKTGKPELGWKYNFMGEQTLVVNRIPIKQKGRIIGAIAQCIFKDISELKEMAGKLDLLENKVRVYRNELHDLLAPKYTFTDIVGCSEAINGAKKLANLYAKTDAPILITGETGTGKELFAHAIHEASLRCQGPFVCLNCASIPAELVESELFGYAPGAFTGANQRGKTGKIRLAHRGTLFLDEIGDMPLPAQAKLLRVLEEKTVERVGDLHPVEADFRLLAATNKDLGALIQAGKFREDLFYRLGTMTIVVPSLRERSEDIPLLARSFVNQKIRGRVKISDEALRILLNQDWRGNVRELRSVIERALTLVGEGEVIRKEHLASYFIADKSRLSANPEEGTFNLKRLLRKDEKNAILKAIQFCKGNKSKAAQLLGISRSLLYSKMKVYEIKA